MTANLEHQRDRSDHANRCKDETDGAPLPGIQTVSGQKARPAPSKARVPATNISSGIVKTVVFII